METNIELCLQGKLALRLQETTAPEFVNLLFETLRFVSGGQMGWQRGQGKAKEEQRKEQRQGGSTRAEGTVGPALYSAFIFMPEYHSRQNPPADLRGWQQSQGHQYLGGRQEVGDRQEAGGRALSEETELRGSLDNSYSFLNLSFHCSSRSWNSALKLTLQLK